MVRLGKSKCRPARSHRRCGRRTTRKIRRDLAILPRQLDWKCSKQREGEDRARKAKRKTSRHAGLQRKIKSSQFFGEGLSACAPQRTGRGHAFETTHDAPGKFLRESTRLCRRTSLAWPGLPSSRFQLWLAWPKLLEEK